MSENAKKLAPAKKVSAAKSTKQEVKVVQLQPSSENDQGVFIDGNVIVVHEKQEVNGNQSQSTSNEAKLSLVSKPDVRLVTSMNLKRTFLTGPIKHAKFMLADSDYRQVVIAGIKYGVVWDELMRGLVARELSGNNPFGGLADYLPD